MLIKEKDLLEMLWREELLHDGVTPEYIWMVRGAAELIETQADMIVALREQKAELLEKVKQLEAEIEEMKQDGKPEEEKR